MSQFNQDRQDSSPGFRKNLRKKSVDVFHMKETEKLSRFVFFSKVLESKITTVIISCFTLYALFADDFRIISTMKETDYIFDGFTITCFIMFFIEIILSLFVKSNYLFSFFFWLDLISTMSLIIDITSINEEILYKIN